MRWNVLVVGLVGCWFAIEPVPSRGAAAPTPTQVASPMPPDQPGVGWVGKVGAWLGEEMLDRFTIPLGPADRNSWPFNIGRELWIGTAPTRSGATDRQ
jgi:hypothetical protein